MSRSNASAALVLLFALVATTSPSAHRLDEYLQAARIGLEPDGVLIELDLTPGVAVARAVIASIDRDGNDSLSGDEQAAYARDVLAALEVKVDGMRLPLQLISLDFPAASAFPRGEGTIRLQARAAHPMLPAGAHLLSFRNTHFENRAAYLANALVPENPRVEVRRQRRDTTQSELTIDYSVQRGSARVTVAMQAVCLAGVVMLVLFTPRPRFRAFPRMR